MKGGDIPTLVRMLARDRDVCHRQAVPAIVVAIMVIDSVPIFTPPWPG
jgi:hypothetical protein